MKLYATVTSERGKPATKGGNDFLRVALLVGSTAKPIDAGTLMVEVKEGTANEYAQVYYNPPRSGDTVTLASIPLTAPEVCAFCKKPADWINDENNDLYCAHCEMYKN
jgi:hypothetical protein